MNKFIITQLCSIGLAIVLCMFTPPIVSYLFLILLSIRVFMFLKPTKGKRIPELQSPQKALVVIDLQESMCGSSGTYPQKEDFVERVNKIIFAAKQNNEKVIYICQEFQRFDCIFCFLAFGGRLLHGTKSACLCSNLEMTGDSIFIKHQQDAFTSKQFVEYLQTNQINELSIVGLDASACVCKTATGAINRGYTVSLIQDGIIGKHVNITNRTLKKLSKRGIAIISPSY